MKIKVTNKNKVFFKKPTITKGNIITYYHKIAPYMIPHTFNRPANLMRAPDGLYGPIFYQQHLPKNSPEWIPAFTVRRLLGGKARHVLCNNVDTLEYLANEGAVTIHIWNSKVNKIHNPDRIVFDLDPPAEGQFGLVREVAFVLKSLLEKLGANPYIMTTGSKGVHVVLPIKPDATYKRVKAFAKSLALTLEKIIPDKTTTNIRKAKRGGKVFLDYLRNNYGQTAVAPYSIRLIPKAPIATPIFWTDLHKKEFGPQTINIKNIFQYLRKGGPWKGIYKNPRSVLYYEKRLTNIIKNKK